MAFANYTRGKKELLYTTNQHEAATGCIQKLTKSWREETVGGGGKGGEKRNERE